MRVAGTRARATALAATAAVALLVTGCAAESDNGSADDVTKITFWNGFTGPDGDALKDRVAAFNDENPDVFVEMTIMPWDVLNQKLMPALGAGEGPNLSLNGVEAVASNALTGAFGDLDEYYERWDEQDALFPTVAGGTSWNDKHYSVPMTFSPMLVYYNKALFADAGLDPENPPADWQELQEAAIALTKDDNGDGTPEQYGLLLASHEGPMGWENLMWDNGGGTVSEDGTTATLGDPKSVEAVELWSGLIKEHDISPGGMNGAEADALFTAGKGAMIIEGPWMSNGFKEAGIDFGVAPLAAGPAGEFAISNSSMFFVSQQTFESDAQKEAVWRFLDFWNSRDNQIAWAVTSGNPPTRTDISADDLAENPNLGPFMDNRAQEVRFYLANVVASNEIRGIYEDAMQKVTSGAGDAQTVMSEAAEQIQQLLDDAK